VLTSCHAPRTRQEKIDHYLSEYETSPPIPVDTVFAKDIADRGWDIKDYKIEKDDTLEISVWQVEELDRVVVVRPDGKISFPLIGDVQAEGVTVENLRKEITGKIADFVRSPQVSVIIKEFGGKRAVVLRETGGGGLIRFTTPITILEALAMSGGYNTDVNLKKIYIIRHPRKPGEHAKIIVVNAQNVLRKGDIRENIYLESDDVVFLARGMYASIKYFKKELNHILEMSTKYTYAKPLGALGSHQFNIQPNYGD